MICTDNATSKKSLKTTIALCFYQSMHAKRNRIPPANEKQTTIFEEVYNRTFVSATVANGFVLCFANCFLLSPSLVSEKAYQGLCDAESRTYKDLSHSANALLRIYRVSCLELSRFPVAVSYFYLPTNSRSDASLPYALPNLNAYFPRLQIMQTCYVFIAVCNGRLVVRETKMQFSLNNINAVDIPS